MDCFWFQNKVSEESRLAVTVHQIDEEVSVVPRGAFVKTPHGLVQSNRSFGGKYISLGNMVCVPVCHCGALVLHVNDPEVFHKAWLKCGI